MNDADAALDLRFGRESFATFAGDFEVGFVPFMCVLFHKASIVEGWLKHRGACYDEIADGQGTTRGLLNHLATGAPGAPDWNRSACARPP